MRFQVFFLGIMLGFGTGCSSKSFNSSALESLATQKKIPKNSAQAKFKKLKIPSIDKALKEAAQLDGRLVSSRNTLQTSRHSVTQLAEGNLKSLQNEIARLLLRGVFSLKMIDGTPSLQYNEAKGNPRAKLVFSSIKSLEANFITIKTELPAMNKDVKQLVKRSEDVLQKSPSEIQRAISSGSLQANQGLKTLKKGSNNINELKKLPIHLKEVQNELKKSKELFSQLF